MRPYTSIMLLSLLSISSGNFLGIESASAKQLPSTSSELAVSMKPRNEPSPDKGTGRRDAFSPEYISIV
ncbi:MULTISPECIES: hypothetical protein [unclassified Coleofasciculus]|uniref:hypothetical protein n=1 Tax=Cyanophyceae TaxID=3028117 RepID=UPI0016898E24|nr:MULTISPECIES: hypothetical protein [unclassified Coleofasciculus]MBD1840455.1 hypothetical protein [Coleofasciculus sp. FACHB-501]